MKNLNEIKDLVIVAGQSTRISKPFLVTYKSLDGPFKGTRISSGHNKLKVAETECRKLIKMMGWDCEVVENK